MFEPELEKKRILHVPRLELCAKMPEAERRCQARAQSPFPLGLEGELHERAPRQVPEASGCAIKIPESFSAHKGIWDNNAGLLNEVVEWRKRNKVVLSVGQQDKMSVRRHARQTS